MSSNAVSVNDISAVVGVLLAKGYNNTSTPNLPQSISVFAEANTANQSGLSTTPFVATTTKKVAQVMGDGSPAAQIARILFNAGVAVPVRIYPQLAAVSSVAKVITITPTGTATAAGTIYLNVAGRETTDTGNYAINIVVGDTPTIISGKFRTALAASLSCPVTGSGTTTCVATAKWTGLTSDDITISVDLNGTSLGTTYAVVNTTAGSGTPSVAASLALFGNDWNTIVINSYGFVSATITEFETFNGVPDPTNPTGQYRGTIMRPSFVLTGTLLDDPTTLTDINARRDQVTIVTCPAPLSQGMSFEAAANVAALFANQAQNTPQGTTLNQYYPDMPPAPAGAQPQMNDHTFRNYCATHGCSTVDYTGGIYRLIDLLTTYNTAGEYPPFYRYARDLNIYFNVKFGYYLLVIQNLQGKTLMKDSDVTTADNVTKPRTWKAIVSGYIDDLVLRALIVDAAFSNAGLVVTINGTNPNRVDTEFPVKISGVAYTSATTITGGFNFSN